MREDGEYSNNSLESWMSIRWNSELAVGWASQAEVPGMEEKSGDFRIVREEMWTLSEARLKKLWRNDFSSWVRRLWIRSTQKVRCLRPFVAAPTFSCLWNEVQFKFPREGEKMFDYCVFAAHRYPPPNRSIPGKLRDASLNTPVKIWDPSKYLLLVIIYAMKLSDDSRATTVLSKFGRQLRIPMTYKRWIYVQINV